MRWCVSILLAVCLVWTMGGCPGGLTGGEANPFLTLTETLGFVTFPGQERQGGAGGGAAAEIPFRRSLTLTLANNHPTAELQTTLLAWVNTSSIRNADQQDALLRDGYIQLASEVRIGSVFTLPPGTFVKAGSGVAGAIPIRIGPATAQQAEGGGAAVQATVREITLVTPDVILFFMQPPVSCDSVAFQYRRDGDNLGSEPAGLRLFQGNTGAAGDKTYAQVNVFQCSPLRPGLFLKIGGGAKQANEFLEGENIRIDFNEMPSADGDFAIVTIGGP